MAGARQFFDTHALPTRKEFLFGFEDGEEENERLRMEVYTASGIRIFRYDQMIVTQVGDVDSEKLQFDISAHGLSKGVFFSRNVKAISISAVLIDLEQEEEAPDPLVIHDQLALFEYLYERYMRAPQLARHKYRLEVTVRGHTYIGLISNVIIGLASDDDTIGAVSFTLMILDEVNNLPEPPAVFNRGIPMGPATFSKETFEDVDGRGEAPSDVLADASPELRGKLKGIAGVPDA